MHLEQICITNYKSFADTQCVKLSRGINIVVGKNNVGKTSFLEALTFKVDKPHRSFIKKYMGFAPDTNSGIFGTIAYSKEEFYEFVKTNSNGFFFLSEEADEYLYEWRGEQGMDGYFRRPVRPSGSWPYKVPSGEPMWQNADDEVIFFFEKIRDYFQKDFSISFLIDRTSKCSKFDDLYSGYQAFNKNATYKFKLEENGFHIEHIPVVTEVIEDSAQTLVTDFIESHIYKFDIHRKVGSNYAITKKTSLATDCSNLPALLLVLQGDPISFSEYKHLIQEVFPEVHDVIVFPNDRNEAEIRIWNTNPIRDRIDLAVPLQDCGTGIGQVLAILYIVVSSINHRVIIIDEPNSFLHPSASRKLINIFKRYPQHQYIVSTHSPEIIASNPDNLILLTLENGETRVKVLEKRQKQDIHDAMKEIGFKLSDVYGYDSILWVEGPTEQACFPKIISMYYPKLEGNMAIVAVRHTGDFEKKYIDTTYALYEKISSPGSKSVLIPPAVAFVFDREGKSEKEITDWKRGREKIHFTKVRLYENYILDEDAIASVLNAYSAEYEWEETYTIEEIKKWLDSNKTDNKYWDNNAVNHANAANWKDQIHAAKLLEDLFGEFTDHKVSYQKTVDSVKLTEYLLENKPEAFDSLKQLLDKFLPK